ncbi:hypothetical protein FJZ19_05660 [Candidatus Pacearchaeota archaeon]|nr:hypothetical protein [Candidatus Pacearchaeota archaeon]
MVIFVELYVNLDSEKELHAKFQRSLKDAGLSRVIQLTHFIPDKEAYFRIRNGERKIYESPRFNPEEPDEQIGLVLKVLEQIS